MEKLKLEHLAPYLPYRLKIEPIYRSCSGGFGLYQRELDIDVLSRNEIEEIKPNLRPRSYLTKEIEHNGERFVPYDEIKKLYSNTPQFTEYKDNWIDIYGIMDSKCEYVCVQKLIEWHFDVFGLIEKGLAIDVNTCK